ncbi:hypothetical protein F4774DRAFT_422088 [Daldinia eschscholtzii]|nr:hypothetical protein F4774DRAFT_422088 [Daldinia eschscholtzii]
MDNNQQAFPWPLNPEDSGFSWFCDNETRSYDDPFDAHPQSAFYDIGLSILNTDNPIMGHSNVQPLGASHCQLDLTYPHDSSFNNLYGERTHTESPGDYHFDASSMNYTNFNINMPSQTDSNDLTKGRSIDIESVDISLAGEAKPTHSQQRQFKCQYCDKYTGKTWSNLKEHVKYTHIGNYCMWNSCGFQGTEIEVREHVRSRHATKIIISDTTNGISRPHRYKCNWEFQDGARCTKTFTSFESVVREMYHHNGKLCLS